MYVNDIGIKHITSRRYNATHTRYYVRVSYGGSVCIYIPYWCTMNTAFYFYKVETHSTILIHCLCEFHVFVCVIHVTYIGKVPREQVPFLGDTWEDVYVSTYKQSQVSCKS